jgi:hypothetical protein
VWNNYDWYSCRQLVTVRGMKAVEDCTVAFVNGFHEGALGRARDPEGPSFIAATVAVE